MPRREDFSPINILYGAEPDGPANSINEDGKNSDIGARRATHGLEDEDVKKEIDVADELHG